MYDASGYLGFTFAGRHSSEFGLLVVSDGSRYHQNLFSNFSDAVVTASGKSGGYYFGTKLNTKDFYINCVFDNITTHIKNKIQNWLYPNKIGWLVFDEAPYKKYLVKISQNPDFSFLPFDLYKQTRKYGFEQEILKGELNLSFVSYEEYGILNENYDIPAVYENGLISQKFIDSELLPSNYITSIIKSQKSSIIEKDTPFFLYNAGNGISKANFFIIISANDINEEPIEIVNLDDMQTYRISDFRQEFKDVSTNFYYIEILSDKQEIWAYSSDGFKKGNKKVNIGNYYNQYYPKIYHKKSSEIMIVTQSRDTNLMGNNEISMEPLFYPYTDSNIDYLPSDSSKNDFYSFEEFNSKWSDYIACTRYGSFEVNDILTPATLYAHVDGTNFQLEEETIIFLVYPNRFSCNKNLKKFTPVYEHTYM